MNITEWTTALRYRPYHLWDKEYTKTLEEQVQQSTWRLDFHIQPKSGLLNDPNGFSTSMVNGTCFTKLFLMVLCMD